MKRFIYLFTALTSLLIIGCSKDGIVSPEVVSDQNDYKLIQLPKASGMHVNTIYSDSKNVDGSIGGTLSLQGSYAGGPFGTVTVNSTLQFPAGAFSGTKTISMTADDQYCASTFQPGMSFAISGIYNITYTGVDLAGINPATVKFVYLKNDGTLEYPSHEGIIVDFATGKISVKNAKLNHFSRYGFVN
ncbi:MAG: hypothetical protein HXY50_07540 [Ignavibacteriaceae bacterium]|nr:hypothetical protein [Ignavibacteriaceae bacterium]